VHLNVVASTKCAADATTYHAYDEHRRKAEQKERHTRRNVRIILIRHAESEANLRPEEIGGRQNQVALSNKGREQALWLGKRLASMHARGVHFDEIYASTATRAADTASIACAQLSFPVTIKHSDQIVELSQGSWERMDRNSVYTKEVLERINNNNWEFAAPGYSTVDESKGESQRDLELRMLAFVESLLSANAGSGTGGPTDKTRVHTVAIFTHGMAIKCLMRAIAQWSPAGTYKVAMSNTALTEIEYSIREGPKGGWSIARINDASHLER